MNRILSFILFCLPCFIHAQPTTSTYPVGIPANRILYYYINEVGDTVHYLYLREVVITAPRYFKKTTDYRRYLQYRRYAANVQPYATKAVATWRALEAETRDASKRDRKKAIAELQDKLFEEFKGPLKSLNRTEGLILIKMIERELHQPFYDIVKDLKGGMTAQYWNQFSKLYGFDLRHGYVLGEDPVMDAVLNDFTLNN